VNFQNPKPFLKIWWAREMTKEWRNWAFSAVTFKQQVCAKCLLFRRDRGAKILWWACLFVCVCLSVHDNIFRTTRPIFTKSFVRVTYGHGSVIFWRHSDMLRISGFMGDVIFARKPRLLDVATRLRQWGSHAPLGFAHRNTRCRQQKLGTTSCSRDRLGSSGRVEYLWQHVCT